MMKRLQVPSHSPSHLMNLLVGKARKNELPLHSSISTQAWAVLLLLGHAKGSSCGAVSREHSKIQIAGTPSTQTMCPWDPIHADHVPLPLQMLFLQQHPAFQCPLDAQKALRSPRLCYATDFSCIGGQPGDLSFFFPLKRSLSPGLHQFIPHFQSSENRSHMNIQVTECTSHTPEDGQGSSSCAGTWESRGMEAWDRRILPAGPHPWLCRFIHGSGERV